MTPLPRIVCPSCDTSYSAERCGLTLIHPQTATIVCGLCTTTFDVVTVMDDVVTSVDTVHTSKWLRRKTTTTETTHTPVLAVRTTLR